MEVFLPIAQVFVNPIEILFLSAIVGVLSGLFGVGGGLSMLNIFFNDTATTEIYTLSLHDALPILMFSKNHR